MRSFVSLVALGLLLAGCSALPPPLAWLDKAEPEPEVVMVRLPVLDAPQPPPRPSPFVLKQIEVGSLPAGFERFKVVKDSYANEIEMSDRQMRAEIRRIEKTLSLKPARIVAE